ncbi:MAG TPA: isoprenylcysteine carboxylmethyltransferase family protein [Oscillospiraceae bacterium]|nr:isoprenylcysteine carboxylmethyltransferase family protein [Oscillospiraceae bacterium]
MDKLLFVKACVKYVFGVLLLFLLLFIPAGSLRFWNAWLFMALVFIPILIAGVILMIKNPSLLQKRLNSKEKEPEQKRVVLLSAVMFAAGFIVAGLDFRFNWLKVPYTLSIVAVVIFIFSYLLYMAVMRQNVYLSRTIEIQENQRVIDTGLYGIVRHPMYLSTILLFLSVPLILGSLFSLLVFLMYPAIIVKRIQNEEQVLERGLRGYTAYQRRVKYRLIPFIW